MTLPRLLARYRDQVKAGLADELHGEGLLYAILRYHVGLEDGQGVAGNHMGKFLRPSLVLSTAEELGGKLDQALPAALALELIHDFSLIHDDVQDGDRTRRGRPSVWSRYGVDQAINAGDLMQALAVSQALRTSRKVTQALLEATVEMIEGQGLDLDGEHEPVAVPQYLKMIDKKTGALIRCAFRLGAMVAGAPTEIEEALVEMGTQLGRAFQIRDDLLAVWGDKKATGKPQGSDIRRRKKSLPAAIALSRAVGVEQGLLRELYDKQTLTDEDVKTVVGVMEQVGAHQAGQQMVIDYLSQAQVWLAKVPFSESGKKEMEELIDYLARRAR